MSRKKRAQDLRAAKDARMKKIAIGGAVLLVAVLAFEVPKMMHGNKSSSPAPATTTTAATTPGAPTSTAVPAPSATPSSTAAPAALIPAAATATSAASTKLTNSDVEPKLKKSQLYSFTHFAGKDPFVQQIKTSTQGTSAGGSSTSTTPTPPTAATQTAAVSHHTASRLLATNGSARISINGQVQIVRVGAIFPSSNPLFRLISVANGVARIGIAHGSYSSGAKTVSLAAGRSLTLVDTADGIRYRIRLVA